MASVLGSLAAAALCVAWFLPWVIVSDRLAANFQATVERAVESRGASSDGTQRFQRVAERMRTRGGLSGIEFIHWLRAGQVLSRELDAETNPGVEADEHVRRLELVRILLYGIPLAAFLLAAHFCMHRLRRARGPVLILCIVTGLASVLTAAVLDFSLGFAAPALHAHDAHLGVGWHLLLWGGGGLATAGVFGVRANNWFRVYAISAATIAALGLVALAYLESGGLQ